MTATDPTVTKSASNSPFSESVAALDAAHRLAREFVAGLATRPVGHRPTPENMQAALDEPLPDEGCDPASAIEEWLRRRGVRR